MNCTLSEADLEHLFAGGVLQLGENKIALGDIGVQRMAAVITGVAAGNTKFNEIRNVDSGEIRGTYQGLDSTELADQQRQLEKFSPPPEPGDDGSYHFSLGNSSQGPIGLCARVEAPDAATAVERLREALQANTEVDLSRSCPMIDEIQYVNVYINPDAVSLSDITGE